MPVVMVDLDILRRLVTAADHGQDEQPDREFETDDFRELHEARKAVVEYCRRHGINIGGN